MSRRSAGRGAIVRADAPSHVGGDSRPTAAASVHNDRPLTVTDLVEKFDKSAYTIREWAKKGKLKGAKRVGRDWAFPLDVDYSDDARTVTAPTVQLAVKEALEQLNRYPVGAARAA